MSRNPEKKSFTVARYLKENGFTVVPVNPFSEEILGEKCYPTLSDMPEEIRVKLEIIDVFRPSEEVLQIAEQAAKLRETYGNLHILWMQLGVVNHEAAVKASKSGLTVIMDRCIMREHKRLIKKER